MQRKCIYTGIGSNSQIDIEVYKLFKQGWILDPWLHGSNRPWTTPATMSSAVGIVAIGEQVGHLQTMHIWNLILLEEDDDITDPEWVLANCPV